MSADDESEPLAAEMAALALAESEAALSPAQMVAVASALTSAEARASPWAQKAVDQMLAGQWGEAVASLRELSDSGPDGALDASLEVNLALAQFRAGLTDLDGFYRALWTLYQSLENRPDFEVVDHVPLMYNLAWAATHVREFKLAYMLLSQLHPALGEASATRPSDDPCVRSVLPLLLVVLSVCRLPHLLQDVLTPDTEEVSGLAAAPRLLAKAASYVHTRQNKAFKRDLKPTCVESEEHMALLEFYRANVEYLRGNQRKAQKMLANFDSKGSIGPRLLPLFQNNLGCIYLMNGSHCSASMAFKDAYNGLKGEKAPAAPEDHSLQWEDCSLEVLYNFGVAALLRQDIGLAMKSLLPTAPIMNKSPHYYLRLAECVIAANSPPSTTFESLRAETRRSKKDTRGDSLVNFNVLGPMFHEKMVLENTLAEASPLAELEKQYPDINWDLTEARRYLNFALICYENHANFPLASMSHVPITSRLDFLQANIVLKQCYVDLRLHDYYNCHFRASGLLEATTSSLLSPALRALATLYLAEAKVLMGDTDGALDDLDPEQVKDITYAAAAVSSEDKDSTPAQLAPTKAIFEYNVAVAWLMKDDLDKAELIVERLLSNQHEHNIAASVTMAKIYILLKRGQVKSCREFIFQECNVTSSLCSELSESTTSAVPAPMPTVTRGQAPPLVKAHDKRGGPNKDRKGN